MVLSELKKDPDHGVARFCYHKQVQQLKPLAGDVAHYLRARSRPSKTDYSCTVLLEVVDRHIRSRSEREDNMQRPMGPGLTVSSDRAMPTTDENSAALGQGTWQWMGRRSVEGRLAI